MAGFFKKFGSLLIGVASAFLFGPGAFNATAFALGSTFAGLLLNKPPKGELTGAQVQKANFGAFIPIVYGRFPGLAGNIMDCPEDGALEEVPWESGSIKRSFTGAIMFCLGEDGDGCGERRIDKLTLNDILFFNRSGATDAEKLYLWYSGASFTYDAATGMEHFGGRENVKGFWGTSNEFYLYRGTRTQAPCPALAALHGGKVPAYRDCVYVAFNRLVLKPWDEALPVFKAEIYNATTGVREIIEGHLVRGGIESGDLDLAALDTAAVTDVDGAIQLEQQNPRQLVDALAGWAFADICETDGRLVASDRTDPAIITLTRDELGAYEANAEDADAPPALKITVGDDGSVPNTLTVRFYDKGLNGEINSVPAPRQVGEGNREQTLDLPIVTDVETARKWAQMALDELWSARTPVEVSLLPARIKAAPGDVLRVPDESGAYSDFRIVEQTLAAPGVIACNALSWSSEPYNQPHAPGGYDWPPGTITPQTAPDTVLLDTVCLDGDAAAQSGPTLIFAASAASTQSFARVDLSFRNLNNEVASIRERAVLGVTNTELTIGSTVVYDAAKTVRVTLTDTRQELATITEAQARAGANQAFIGGHLVKFLTATYVSPGVYDLSDILFGLRGSEWATMPSGSSFLLLYDENGDQAPGWTQFSLSGLDNLNAFGTKDFFVEYGLTGDTETLSHAFARNSLKAISPATVELESDGSGGQIMRFLARVRGDAAEFTQGSAVLTDPLAFDVVLLDGVTVLDTRRVTTLRAGTETQLETTYTNGQLAAIYGGASTELEGIIYPINSVGRGFGRSFAFSV